MNHVHETDQLFEFRACDDECAFLFARDPAKQFVDLRARSHIDSLRGLFDQQHTDVAAQRTRKRDLLLVAAA